MIDRFILGGLGFLRLMFGVHDLDDDADYFFKKFKYPKTFGRSSTPQFPTQYVIIQIRQPQEFELFYERFTCKVLCHEKTPVRFLRQYLARTFLVAFDSLAFSVDGQTLKDSDLVHELRKTTIAFTTPDYLPVMLTLTPTSETILFPKSATVRDLVSMVQYRFFFHER
jgi:hypothetical protein